MIKKTKEEKLAKHKRKKSKHAAKEKRRKREVTELEKMAVRRALLAELIPSEWPAPDVEEIAEPEPEETEGQTPLRKGKEKKAAKRKRAKEKSAAKEKARKRKIAKSKKSKAEKERAFDAASGSAPEEDRLEAAKAKSGKRGRKAAAGRAKKESAAQPEAEALPKDLPQESKHAETEKITVRKALLVEPIPESEAADLPSGTIAGEVEEAPSAHDWVQGRDAHQPGAPVAPPSAQRAADSPSRFWPGVALGTVAVIVGFGYIRHLAREEVVPAPVTAESEREALSASPTVADTVIAKTEPPALAAPSAVGQTSRLSTGSVDPDEAAQSGEVPSEPTGSAPDRSSRTTVQRQKGVPTDPKPVAAQSSPAVSAPPAGAEKEQTAAFRPKRKAPPAAQYQVIRPRIPAEVARWRMPRLYQPYQPYRPQFQPVPPGYQMYVCPAEPRVLRYPSAKSGD